MPQACSSLSDPTTLPEVPFRQPRNGEGQRAAQPEIAPKAINITIAVALGFQHGPVVF